MIRHPLVRCALFVVFFLLASILFRFGFLSALTATVAMLLLDRRSVDYVGLWPASARQMLAGLALGGGMIAVSAFAMRVTGHLQWQSQDFAAKGWLDLAGLLLPAAIAEELLFRGYGFQRLVEGVGRAPALAFLSLFFAFGHRNNPNASWIGLANTVLVGIVFGMAYLRTRQLWLPIAWHWSWNFAEASLGFPVSGIRFPDMPLVAVTPGSVLWTGGDYGPEASLPVTLVLLAGLVLVLRLKQVHLEETPCLTESPPQ